MIMSPLIAFLIVFVLLLIALIKLKVTPSVGLFAAAIIFGLMVGMPAADILSKLPAGFGNMMTSIGLLIVFGSIFGDFLGNSGATEELAKGMVRLFGKKNDYLALNLVGLHPLHPHLLRLCLHHDGPAGDCLAEDQQKEHEGLCHRHLYRPDAYPQLRRTYSRPSGRRRQIGANVGWFIIWGIIVCLPASLLVGWVYANLVNSKEEKQRAPRRDEGDRGGRRPPRSRPHQALRAESLPARHVPHRPHRFRSHLLAVRHGGPCLHRHQLCRQLQHRPLHRHARHWLCSASVYA